MDVGLRILRGGVVFLAAVATLGATEVDGAERMVLGEYFTATW